MNLSENCNNLIAMARVSRKWQNLVLMANTLLEVLQVVGKKKIRLVTYWFGICQQAI